MLTGRSARIKCRGRRSRALIVSCQGEPERGGIKGASYLPRNVEHAAGIYGRRLSLTPRQMTRDTFKRKFFPGKPPARERERVDKVFVDGNFG